MFGVNKGKKRHAAGFFRSVVLILILCVLAAGLWLIKADLAYKIAAICGLSLVVGLVLIYQSITRAMEFTRTNIIDDSRPILSYLGRVYSKAESAQPRAEATINKLLIASGEKTKVNAGLEGNNVIFYEELLEDQSGTPIVMIRPFFFANYGRSVALGLTVLLDDDKITDRIDYVIESNAKISFEINDAIEFKKGMKFFTLCYYDIFGNEYRLALDGVIEYAEEESQQLKRDVYFYYVDGFRSL